MSNYLKAISFVLRHEGGLLQSKVTGEYSNYGITKQFLNSFPYFLADPKNLLKEDAVNIYYNQIWRLYRLDLINSDLIAAKLFDATVNMGKWEAVKCLQQTLFPGESSMIDGNFGQHTVSFLNDMTSNSFSENKVLLGFIEELKRFYNDLANGPNSEKLDAKNNLKGWLIRAEDINI